MPIRVNFTNLKEKGITNPHEAYGSEHGNIHHMLQKSCKYCQFILTERRFATHILQLLNCPE